MMRCARFRHQRTRIGVHSKTEAGKSDRLVYTIMKSHDDGVASTYDFLRNTFRREKFEPLEPNLTVTPPILCPLKIHNDGRGLTHAPHVSLITVWLLPSM